MKEINIEQLRELLKTDSKARERCEKFLREGK